MRVLYLTNNAGRASTTVATAGWVESLQPQGLSPVLVSPILGEFADFLRSRDVACYQQDLPLPDKWRPLPFMLALWRLRSIVRKHRIELIHCNEHDVYPIGQYLSRLCGIPAVVTVHFTVGRKYAQWAFAGRRQPARMFFVSRRNLEECMPALTGIVPRERWAVVHNGLKLADYEPDPSLRSSFRRLHGREGELLIGVACALRPRKQLEHMFAAFERLQTRGVRLLVGGFAAPGDEKYADALIASAQSRLGERFVFLGPLDTLRPLCNGLDLFINTSKEESFGIACLEALACGCPVIGYDSKAVDEVVLPDGGEITPQDDVETLARRIDAWLADPSRLSEARVSARRQAEKFDLRVLSEQLWREYQHVLGETQGRHAAKAVAAL